MLDPAAEGGAKGKYSVVNTSRRPDKPRRTANQSGGSGRGWEAPGSKAAGQAGLHGDERPTDSARSATPRFDERLAPLAAVGRWRPQLRSQAPLGQGEPLAFKEHAKLPASLASPPRYHARSGYAQSGRCNATPLVGSPST